MNRGRARYTGDERDEQGESEVKCEQMKNEVNRGRTRWTGKERFEQDTNKINRGRAR